MKNKQGGVALVTALLILAIASTAAAFLIQQLNLSVRRTGNVINSNQAYLYALGAETLAIIGLNLDAKDNKTDSYKDEWTLEYPPFPVENDAGYIYVKITDLHSRLNVNNLIDVNGKQNPVAIDLFGRLLTLFDINPGVTYAVIDWLDKDTNATGPLGAEDDYYLGLEQPYRCANRKLSSVSELRLIRGLDTAERFNELIQHLVALPERTSININFADRETHYAIIGDALKADLAVRFPPSALEEQEDASESIPLESDPESNRPNIQVTADSIVPYTSVDDYIQKNTLPNDLRSKDDLSVESQFFLVEGESVIDRARTNIKSVLQRDNNGRIRIVSRTQGEL